MKRKKKLLIRLIAAISFMGIAVFIILSSERFGGLTGKPITSEKPSPFFTATPIPTPTSTPVPSPTSTPTPTATNTPSPTNTPTPTEAIYPYTDIENINYANYAGKVSEIKMAEGTLQFGDFGYITYEDSLGATHTYRMSDYVSIPGEDMFESGYWFFMGALETPNYIYAQYDYWGNAEYTLFIRVSRTGRYGIMLDYMPYDELENYRCFTASNEYIFYVDNEDDTYEIIAAGVDGADARAAVKFEPGERPTGLWCTTNELIFFLTDEKGTSLVSMDLETEALRVIKTKCEIKDYLYVTGRYAIVGMDKSSLVFINLRDGKEIRVSVPGTENRKFGEPVCAEDIVYLQVIPWTTGAATEVAVINTNQMKYKQTERLSDRLSFVCGIDGRYLIAEKNGSYVRYEIKD